VCWRIPMPLTGGSSRHRYGSEAFRTPLIEGEARGEPQPFDAASFERGVLALNGEYCLKSAARRELSKAFGAMPTGSEVGIPRCGLGPRSSRSFSVALPLRRCLNCRCAHSRSSNVVHGYVQTIAPRSPLCAFGLHHGAYLAAKFR
jgi:hypothetical protein